MNTIRRLVKIVLISVIFLFNFSVNAFSYESCDSYDPPWAIFSATQITSDECGKCKFEIEATDVLWNSEGKGCNKIVSSDCSLISQYKTSISRSNQTWICEVSDGGSHVLTYMHSTDGNEGCSAPSRGWCDITTVVCPAATDTDGDGLQDNCDCPSSVGEKCNGIDDDCDDKLGDGEYDRNGDGILDCKDTCENQCSCGGPGAGVGAGSGAGSGGGGRIGKIIGAPIDISDGRVTVSPQTDFIVKGVGLDIVFQRMYDSTYWTNKYEFLGTRLGHGWKHNYSYRLAPYTDAASGNRFAEVWTGFNKSYKFEHYLTGGTTRYHPYYHNEGNLFYDASSSVYTYVDNSYTAYKFAKIGSRFYLDEIKDVNGNTLTFEYGECVNRPFLNSITNSSGKTVLLTANGKCNISSIVLDSPRTTLVSYEYASSVVMSKVNYPGESGAYNFEYQNGRLSKVKDKNGSIIEEFEYDEKNRGTRTISAKEDLSADYSNEKKPLIFNNRNGHEEERELSDSDYLVASSGGCSSCSGEHNVYSHIKELLLSTYSDNRAIYRRYDEVGNLIKTVSGSFATEEININNTPHTFEFDFDSTEEDYYNFAPYFDYPDKVKVEYNSTGDGYALFHARCENASSAEVLRTGLMSTWPLIGDKWEIELSFSDLSDLSQESNLDLNGLYLRILPSYSTSKTYLYLKVADGQSGTKERVMYHRVNDRTGDSTYSTISGTTMEIESGKLKISRNGSSFRLAFIDANETPHSVTITSAMQPEVYASFFVKNSKMNCGTGDNNGVKVKINSFKVNFPSGSGSDDKVDIYSFTPSTSEVALENSYYSTGEVITHKQTLSRKQSLRGSGYNADVIYDYDSDYDSDYNEAPTSNIHQIVQVGYTDADADGDLDDSATTIITKMEYNSKGQITKKYLPYFSGASATGYYEYTYDGSSPYDLTDVELKKSDETVIEQYSFTYDDLGQIDTITDELNDTVIDYDYDSHGRVVLIENAGATTEYSYVGDNTASIEYPKGNLVEYTYTTSESRLAAVKARNSSTGSYLENISHSYSVVSYVDTVIQQTKDLNSNDKKKVKIEEGYDDCPLISGTDDTKYRETTEDPDGSNPIVTVQWFNDDGDLIWSVVDPEGSGNEQWTNYAYDYNHRLTDVYIYNDQNDMKSHTRYLYDVHSNLSTVKTWPDVDAASTTIDTNYEYDDFGRLAQVDSPDTNVTRYIYDAAGNLVQKIKNADAEENDYAVHTCYAYDDVGRLSAIKQWEPSSWTSCSATPTPLGGDVYYLYDENDVVGSTKTVEYPYSSGAYGKGKMTAAVSHYMGQTPPSYSIMFYKYDARGLVAETYQVIATDDEDGYTTNPMVTTYSYDDNGNVTQIQYPSGRYVQYEYYDASSTVGTVNQVKAVKYSLDGTTWTTLVNNAAYYPFGDLKTMQYLHYGSDYETITYDRGLRYETKSITVDPSYSATDIFRAAYTYTSDGYISATSVNIAAIPSSSTAYTESFTYNNAGMMTHANGPYGNWNYSYDDVGNRKWSDNGTRNYIAYESGKNRMDNVDADEPNYTSSALGDIEAAYYESLGATVELKPSLAGQLIDVSLRTGGGESTLFQAIYDDQNRRILTLRDELPPIVYNYDLAGNMLAELHLTALDPSTNENPILDYVYLGSRRVAVLTGQVYMGESPCFIATAVLGTSMGTDLDALRGFRDRVLKSFAMGQSFVGWYYRHGPNGARWLNAHRGWKPVVRVGLIIPISISKIIVSSTAHKLAVGGLIIGFVCAAVVVSRRKRWTTSKTVLVSGTLAFVGIILYGIFMMPEKAMATRPETDLQNNKAYFFYEDHIGRPVLLSEYQDYDTDGSYFHDGNEDDHPYWQAVYQAFGKVYDAFGSTGVTIGNTSTTGITWAVPFRFPGQYQDPVSLLYNELYYNWNRYYMPTVGRYAEADPIRDILNQSIPNRALPLSTIVRFNQLKLDTTQKIFFKHLIGADEIYDYASNNPIMFYDPTGLLNVCEAACVISGIMAGGGTAGATAGVGNLLNYILGGLTGYLLKSECIKGCKNFCFGSYACESNWCLELVKTGLGYTTAKPKGCGCPNYIKYN